MGNKRNNNQEIETASSQRQHRKIRIKILCGCVVVLVLGLLVKGGIALANYFYFNNEHFVFRRLEMVPTTHYDAERVCKKLAESPESLKKQEDKGKANTPVKISDDKEPKKVVDTRCVIGVTRLSKVNLAAIRQKLLEDPILEEVEVRRKMPDALSVVLKERRPLAYASGNRKSKLRLIDRNGVLFPFTGMKYVPPDLPFITNISRLEERKNGIPIDDFRLKNAIELIMLVNGKQPVEKAGYFISVVQLNSKYTNQFECYLKAMPDNKVFSKKEITIYISSEPEKMRLGLENLDAILIRKLQEKGTLSFADLTLERNINTRD